MAKLDRFDDLRKKLAARATKYGKPMVSWVVGFQTNYALVVHERLDVHHPVGQAKYLEEPARLLAPEFGETVKALVNKGYTLTQALGICALRLLRDAKILTPVDTSLLKNSGFATEEQVVPKTQG